MKGKPLAVSAMIAAAGLFVPPPAAAMHAGTTPLHTVTGLAVDAATGDLYVAAGYMFRVAAGETHLLTYDHPVAGPLPFGGRGIAFHAGDLYYTSGHSISRYSPATRTFTRVSGQPDEPGFSGDGGSALDAHLAYPWDLAVGIDGSIAVSDWNNARVREIRNGTISTIVGGGQPVRIGGITNRDLPPYGPLQSLDHPEGVAFDALGSLYVADSWHRRVIRVTGGVVTRVVGTGSIGEGGNGGPGYFADAGRLLDVAADADGNVWIAEESDGEFPARVIRVDRAGIVARLRNLPPINAIATHGNDVYFGGPSQTEPDNGCVLKRSPSGSLTTVAGVCP